MQHQPRSSNTYYYPAPTPQTYGETGKKPKSHRMRRLSAPKKTGKYRENAEESRGRPEIDRNSTRPVALSHQHLSTHFIPLVHLLISVLNTD